MAAISDANGVVTNVYDYDPFGVTTETKLTGNLFNPWRYTGQYQDTSTGPYKIGLRYYQPELGRWTQRDPLNQIANVVTPPDANLYIYAAANAVNFIDRLGLSHCTRAQIWANAAIALGANVALIAAVVASGGSLAIARAALGTFGADILLFDCLHP